MAVFDAIKPYRIPTIHFGVGTASLIALMADSGADVLGLDWRVEIDQALCFGRIDLVGDEASEEGLSFHLGRVSVASKDRHHPF